MTTATIPSAVRAGDTLTATWSLADYPASDGWGARLTLVNAGASHQANASASGADHELAVNASTTASWAAGAYAWTIDVARAGVRHTVATGTVQVLPNLAAGSAVDFRTPARKALDAAEAALVTYGAQAYLQAIEIGERRQTFASPGDFLSFVSRLRAEVRREDAADRMRQGLAPRNRLLVRFTGR